MPQSLVKILVHMKENGVSKFYWQRGYGAFSIGQSQVPAVIDYIRNQKEHHKGVSYEDEFRRCVRNTRLSMTNDTCGINIGLSPMAAK